MSLSAYEHRFPSEIKLPLAVTTAAAGLVYDADPQMILFLSIAVAGGLGKDLLHYFTHEGELI